MKKRILALFLALQMVLSYVPVPQALADEPPAAEVPVNGFVKTAAWTDVPGEADITLESDYDHYAIPKTQKILFMGSMCNGHSLDMDTVIGSIASCAQYADVDVRLFDSPQDNTARKVYSFEVAKCATSEAAIAAVTDKINKSKAALASEHHASLYDFAEVIADADMSNYAHIVLEFDGLRMGMFKKTITDDMRADLLSAAKKLVSFYEQDKVSWIICDIDTGFTENTIGYTKSNPSSRVDIKPATVRMFNDCYINASGLRCDNQDYNFYQAGIYDALALVAPEDWLNAERTARKDYPTNYAGFVTEANLPTYFARTATGDNKIWVNYGDAAEVSSFIEKTMEGHDFDKVLVVDEVKEGFIITGVECQYWNATNGEFTELPTPDGEADKYYSLNAWNNTDRKVEGTFKLDAIKTDFETPHIRMQVHIIADSANDPFTGDADGKVNTNKSAKAEYYYSNSKLDTKTATSPTLTGVKITYKSDNTNMGTVSSSAEWVAPNATSAAGSTATPKTGYEFDHWKSNKTSNIETAKINPEPTKEISSDPAEYVYEDITYTAVFAPIEYTVTFDTYGGKPLTIDDQKVKYNEKAIVPETPTKFGYYFKEWVDKDDIAKTPWNFDDKVTGDLNLLATYTPRDDTPYVVEYYYEDSDGTYPTDPETVSAPRIGTTDTQVKIIDSDKVPTSHLATASAKAGLDFVLDERDTYKEDWADETLNGDGSTVLKVYFRRTYDVTFNTDGGSTPPAKQTVFYNEKVNKPADPTKTGYDFVCWEDPDGEEWKFNAQTVTEDLELTATYTPATDVAYKVEYYYQNADGSFSDTPDSQVIRHNGTTGSNIAVTNDDKTPYAPLSKPGVYVLNAAKNENWEKEVAADGSTVLKV
ncbi:MAG: InlB B-repeat-containing protein, partial [Lachnospiraceae bacterium]|nr:InlB B-repeat-containing protein [Candidatus Minthocola equi]